MKKSIIYELSNDKIELVSPTPNELIKWGREHGISNCEKEYFTYLSYFITQPSDIASSLDEMDIDFTKLTNYELFFLMLNAIKDNDTLKQFLDITIKINGETIDKIDAYSNNKTGEMVIGDVDKNIYFTKEIYELIRKIIVDEYGYVIEEKKFASEEAKQIFIQRQKFDCFKRKCREWKCFLHDVLYYLYSDIKSIENIAEFMDTPIADSFKEYIKRNKKECDDKLSEAIRGSSKDYKVLNERME